MLTMGGRSYLVSGSFFSFFVTVVFKLSLTGLSVFLSSLPLQALMQIKAKSKVVKTEDDFGAMIF
jgi:hypothetical protein